MKNGSLQLDSPHLTLSYEKYKMNQDLEEVGLESLQHLLAQTP